MWLAVAILATLVQVTGAGDCPSAAAVEAALARLGPAPVPDRVGKLRLDEREGSLRLTLFDHAGRPVGEHHLPTDGSCLELADAAALVVAVWRRPLDTGPGSPLPSLSPPLAALRSALERPPRVSYDVSVGVAAGFTPGAGVAFGGAVDVALGPKGSRWAGRLGALGLAPQVHDFGPGQVSWTRPALSLGARVQLSRARFAFDLHAEALAALLVATGSGFANSSSSFDFDPGLGAGVRVGYRIGRAVPFLAARVIGWIRSQTVSLEGFEPGYRLPQIDVLLVAGIAVAR